MCNCMQLVKAIDKYIAKVDDDLLNSLNNAGFVDTDDLIEEINLLEDKIAKALTSETRFINKRLNQSVNLDSFFKDWSVIKELDNVDVVLAELFYNSFTNNMSKLATSYIQLIDPVMTVTTISKRTIYWIQSWSQELGELMKLSTHTTVEKLLVNSIQEGKSIAEFTRELMDNGIRDEYYRARQSALTESLRAHSVARQEAIIQNPSTEDKEWVHTGSHRNKPRANHVEMNGSVVPKNVPFTLYGPDGSVYYPMYPRDSILPASESINCHCIHRGIANTNVLGLSLEERKRLQKQAIEEDDGLWEIELNAKNRAKAEIE